LLCSPLFSYPAFVLTPCHLLYSLPVRYAALSGVIDAETGVMLRPLLILVSRVNLCSYIPRHVYYRPAFPFYRTRLGLSRYLDT
jgi:hypothetical protein